MNAEEQKLYPEMLNCYFDALIMRVRLRNNDSQEKLPFCTLEQQRAETGASPLIPFAKVSSSTPGKRAEM